MSSTHGKEAITDSNDLTVLTESNKQFWKYNILIPLLFCLHLMHCYKNVYWKFEVLNVIVPDGGFTPGGIGSIL